MGFEFRNSNFLIIIKFLFIIINSDMDTTAIHVVKVNRGSTSQY